MEKDLYFVFGEYICNKLDEISVKDFVSDSDNKDVSYQLYHWENTSSPIDLLNTYSGCDYYRILTKEEFQLLVSFLD